jgi:DNA-binding response OmpR family regulator
MRILIVEDEKKMAAVLKKGLEAENHRVTLAFDGRDWLELASTMEFDVVVLDLMLPVIDGFEIARRLRRNDNRTPILMLIRKDLLVTEGIAEC